MDPCNYSSKQNCLKGFSCPQGYECCSESKNPSKASPTYGHCVKENTCDFTKGLCSSGYTKSNTFSENFVVKTREGYHDGSSGSCHEKEWKKAFWVLMLILMILGIFVLYLVGKK